MPGFSAETIRYLHDLRAHNDRSWFEEHRDRYEEHWLRPAREFVAAAAPLLRTFAPRIEADPRVNGSIFRVQRDMRFVRDQSPYKDYLDVWFWEGERQTAVSGFYLRLTPDRVGVGAGAHRFDPARLAEYRALVMGDGAYGALADAVAAVEAAGCALRGAELKQLPRGIETDDEGRARLLRHRALWSVQDVAHPGVLGSQRFVAWCARRWEQQLPLHRWLVDHLGG